MPHHLQLVTPSQEGTSAPDGRLHLAPNLIIHPDKLIGDGNGILGTGMPGSGKTTLFARLLEQFGLCGLPFAVFDLEGDLTSVTSFLPRGVRATAENCPTVKDMYQGGLQVIFDLSTWGKESSHAASLMTTMVSGLLDCTKALPPHARVPFLVGLDEAAYWLPQSIREKSYLETGQFKELFSIFHHLSLRGRKMGLIPLFFTQRIANVHKDVLTTTGTIILMKQTIDTDLKRYMEYISVSAFGKEEFTEKEIRARIAAFKLGQAVIRLPNGKQGVVQFYNRTSEHLSHAPKTEAAFSTYRDISFDPNRRYGAFEEEATDRGHDGERAERAKMPKEETSDLKHDGERQSGALKTEVFAALDADPTVTARVLAKTTGRSISLMQQYRNEYFVLFPEKSRQRRATTLREEVFALLSADPTQSSNTLARATKHPVSTVQGYRTEYFTLYPEKRPPAPIGKIEQAVHRLVAENPGYTVTQIARLAHCATRDVKRVLARVQE